MKNNGALLDEMFDELFITYGQVWLATAGSQMPTAVGTTLSANGSAVGLPAVASDVDARLRLSVWAAVPPDGRGDSLGEESVDVPDREVMFFNADGREPGPVMVLPEGGTYQVRAWRIAGPGEPELFDVRMWLRPV